MLQGEGGKGPNPPCFTFSSKCVLRIAAQNLGFILNFITLLS